MKKGSATKALAKPHAPVKVAPPKKLETVFYAVTMYITRDVNKEDMLKHYKFNGDPVILFSSEREMREHERAALKKAFPEDRKEKGK